MHWNALNCLYFVPILQVPTLILRGSEDAKGAISAELLKQIPTSQEIVVPDAGHRVYVNQPNLFHLVLHNFLLYLNDHTTAL